MILPDGTGMGLCRQVRARHLEVSCVIVTGHDEGEALFAAVMGGAAGFLTRDSSAKLLIDTVRRAAGGARLTSSATMDDPLALLVQTAADSRLKLTEQQHLIFERVLAGRTDEQIAAEFGLDRTSGRGPPRRHLRQHRHGAHPAGSQGRWAPLVEHTTIGRTDHRRTLNRRS